MGFIDKNSRVLDFQFTAVGRELYASGKLNFEYYEFFDDEIFYQENEKNNIGVDDTIDDINILEAPFIKNRFENNLSPQSALFTAPSNYKNVPHIKIIDDTNNEISADQKSIDGMYEILNANCIDIHVKLDGDTVGADAFLLSVFESGSDGLRKLTFKNDSAGLKMYDQNLVVLKDNLDSSFIKKINLQEDKRKK